MLSLRHYVPPFLLAFMLKKGSDTDFSLLGGIGEVLGDCGYFRPRIILPRLHTFSPKTALLLAANRNR